MNPQSAVVRQPYRLFSARVSRTEQLSPRFLRVTLEGEQLRDFAPERLDRRIKIVLPDARGGYADFWRVDGVGPATAEWRALWRALPEADRNPVRTYTPSGVRPGACEIDIDFVLHDPPGPASRWARAARVGDVLVVSGPDVGASGPAHGIQWQPGRATSVLLLGDETALPAMRNIAGELGPEMTGWALIEAGSAADLLAVGSAAKGLVVTGSAREGAPAGSRMRSLFDAWATEHGARAAGLEDRFFAWVAGEATEVARLRKALVSVVGVAADRVQVQGYWRTGPRRTL